MGNKNRHVGAYARMWPREVFDRIDTIGNRKQALVESLQVFDKPGVYILYRNDVPYYVGQAGRLRRRIRKHAYQPGSQYYNFWNFFSAFVIEDSKTRNEVEGVLIAAMPTANGAKPKLPKEKFPKSVREMMRDIRRNYSNPG
jgi:hypothetical protein